MSFRDVCELISGAVSGTLPSAVSRLDDSDSSASEALFAWVHAELVERNVDLDDDGTEAVRKIVALAMLAQRNSDKIRWTSEEDKTAAIRAPDPVTVRKSAHRGYKIVQFGECGIFKNSWDDEPLAYVSSWDLAEEWVAKRIAQEKKTTARTALATAGK